MTKYKPEKYNLSDDQSCAADEPQWSKFGGFLTLWPDTYIFDFLQELFSLKFAFFHILNILSHSVLIQEIKSRFTRNKVYQ